MLYPMVESGATRKDRQGVLMECPKQEERSIRDILV